jgi:hypothetical protein
MPVSEQIGNPPPIASPPPALEGGAAGRTEAAPEASERELGEAPPAEPEQAESTAEKDEQAKKQAEMRARAAAIVRYLASLYGAGGGYTGVSAGQSGFTGVGAGDSGFTGVGAGDSGFTGVGAGSGYTGMGAEAVPEVNLTSPPPGVLMVPVRPFFFYPMP